MSAGQLEAEDVGVVDDAFERFVARGQESRVVAESVGDELAEALEQGQQLFDVLLRVLRDDVGRFNLVVKSCLRIKTKKKKILSSLKPGADHIKNSSIEFDSTLEQ